MDYAKIPLYNSRIIDTYIRLIRRNYPFVNITELIDSADIKLYEVADQGHWFTQSQIDQFYEKLVHLTGNENIAREAGRYAASPDAIGVMRQYVIGMIGPAKVYEMVDKTAVNFTRSAIYKSKKISPTKYEIMVTPLPGVKEKPFQCLNRVGFFESVVMMINHTFPDIKHTECVFTGDKSCKYIVSWKNTVSGLLKRVRNYLLLFNVIFLSVYFSMFASFVTSELLLLLSCLISILGIGYVSEIYEKRQLKISLENLKDSSEKLLDQMNANYNNALMTNEIGQAIGAHTSIKETIDSLVGILEKRLDFDRGLILLADSSKTRLSYCANYGYSEEQIHFLNKASFDLDKPESRGVFVVSFREKIPILINDLNEIENSLSPRSLAFARKIGAQSFICCPISCEGQPIGILAVDNVSSKRPLVQSDVSLLMGVASVIGISIRNAELLRGKVEQFQSMLQVLSASTDARDFLTAGHSEKVTEYSLGICQDIGLPDEYCQVVRVAALLHDYGKIAVPDVILKKEGRLTEEEYEIVKTHAWKTREILERINFEGAFRQVPEIAGAHHEKVDGTGYPQGLKGKEIPLGAKIIAVADFFEAITAKRHYREPMPIYDAFRLLRQGIGTHFEKKFVEAFIRFYTRTYPDHLEPRGDGGGGNLKRSTRLPCRTQLSIRSEGKAFFGTSADLSLWGMFVATDGAVREESQVELSFALPDVAPSLVTVLGEVVWVNAGEEKKKPGYPPGFGVRFLELQANVFQMIQDFMAARSTGRRTTDEQLPLNLPAALQ